MNTQDYPELSSSRSRYNICPEITSGSTAVENSLAQIIMVYSKLLEH